MEIKKGIGVSPGVVISTAVVLDAEDLLIPKRQVDAAEVAGEVERLDKRPRRRASADLDQLARRRRRPSTARRSAASSTSTSASLRDKSIAQPDRRRDPRPATHRRIRRQHRHAAGTPTSSWQMTDRYLSERVKDIYDIERRLLRNLIGQKHEDLLHLTQDVVVIAHDLLPSQTAALDRIARERLRHRRRRAHQPHRHRRPRHGHPGRRRAGQHHRRSQRRRHRHHRRHPRRGHRQPRRRAARRAPRDRTEAASQLDRELATSPTCPAETLDGHVVSLQANIEFPEDIDDALRAGRRGHRAVPHRIPLPDQRDTSRARKTTSTPTPTPCAGSAASRWSSARWTWGPTSTPRPRLPEPRAQPVPGRPLHPDVPARHPDVQAAAPGDHAGQRARATCGSCSP